MRITGFIWLKKYVEKLEVIHGVSTYEVEQLFTNQPRIRKVKRGYTSGEDVYRAIGQTDYGRYLFVIFIFKKVSREALIISGRDATKKERKSHGKK